MRLAAIVAVALALRLYGIGTESFWIDEVFQRDVSAQPLARIVADYRPLAGEARLRDQAPLSHLLFHFVVGSGPVSDEATARLPSAIAGALDAGVFFLLARRLLAPATATLATALLVLSPLDLWYGQELRFYELWLLIATCATSVLTRVVAGGTLRWWAAYAALTVAGLYTCLMHALVVAAHGLTLLWIGAREDRLAPLVRRAVGVLVVVALATLPIAWIVLNEHGRQAGTPRPPSLAALPYTLFAFAAGYSLGPTVESLHALPSPEAIAREHPSVVVTCAVFGAALAAGLVGIRRRPFAAAVLIPLLVVPPLAVLALSYGTHVVYNVRYALPALLAFLALVAEGCLAPTGRLVRAGAIGAVLAVTLVSDAHFYADPRYDKADARAAMAFVRTEGEPAHVLIAGQLMRVVDYYTRGTDVTWQNDCTTIDAAAHDTLWLAAGRDWEHDASTCLARVATTHRVAEYRRFPGIELWRLTRR